MLKRITLPLLFVLISGIATTSYGQIYVDDDATGANDGSSWVNAYTSLNNAINNATGSDVIVIAGGIYKPGSSQTDYFTITGHQDGLKIYGGWAGTETFVDIADVESQLNNRDFGASPTILSGDIGGDDAVNSAGITENTDDIIGDNSYHVVLFDGGDSQEVGSDVDPNITPNTILDGVTITGGQATGSDEQNYTYHFNDGGGVYCDGVNPDNECSPTMRNVIFVGNEASQDGGALFNIGLHFNGTDSNGGKSNPVLTNVLFVNNKSTKGGAVANYGRRGESSPVITNAIFVGNRAEREGGAIWGTARPYGSSKPTITNTIFWGNSAPAGANIENYDSGVVPTLSHTIIEGGTGSINTYETPKAIFLDENGSSVSFGQSTNLDDDPQFARLSNLSGEDNVFATADDGLYVMPGSPALDTGSNDALPSELSVDLSGANRINNSTVDIGAYEDVYSAPLMNSFTPTAAVPGDTITITGMNFDNTTDIQFNGISTTSFTTESETKITAVVPQTATSGPITANTIEGAITSTRSFQVISPPYGSGRALTLDGDGDYIELGNEPAFDLTGNFTIEFWMKVDADGFNDSWEGIITKGDDAWRIQRGGNNGNIEFGTDIDANISLFSSTNVDDGQWHHIAAVYDQDGSEQRLYIDGVLEDSNNQSGDVNVTDYPVHIGGNSERSGRTFGGMIDEVRIWKKVRTQEEIQRKMHQTIEYPANVAGLAGYWRFDEDSDTAYDLGGTAQGTLHGNATRITRGSMGLGQTSTLVAGGETAEVGPTSGSMSISNTGENMLTIFRYGDITDNLIEVDVPGEDFSQVNATWRLNTVWGIEPSAGSDPTADVTIDFSGATASLPSQPRLLKREGPGSPWQDVTAQFTYDSGAKTFTASGVTDFSQFAIGGGTTEKTIYVDASATGADDGTSWTDAFASLQDALTAATGNDEIWIAEGIYYPDEGNSVTDGDRSASFTVTGNQNGLKIYGGFESGDSFTDRNPGDHPVVLSGDIDDNDTKTNGVTLNDGDISGNNSFHVFLLDGGDGIGTNVTANITASSVLNGVTITGGQANGSTSDNAGGGLVCDGEGAENECSPKLDGVVFAGNTASNYGGAIINQGYDSGKSNPTITNAIFTGNSANNGGAILNNGDSGTSSPTITNTTFAGNTALSNGGAILNNGTSGTSNPTITNTILYGNSASNSGNEIFNNTATATVIYSLVEGSGASGGSWDTSLGIDAGNNIDADPLFANSSDPNGADNIFANSDDGLTLSSGSPALDTGTDQTNLPTTDVTSAERIQNGVVDLGAYESSLSAPLVNAFTPLAATPGGTITIAGAGFSGTTSVQFDGTTASDFTVESATQITATIPQTATSGTITVTNNDGSSTSTSSLHVASPPYGSGRALTLDGDGDYVEVGNEPAFDLTGNFTIELWIKVDADGFDNSWEGIITKGDDAWRIQRDGNSGRIEFGTDIDANISLISTTRVDDGQWHHIAAVYDQDGSEQRLYIDGVLEDSNNENGDVRTTDFPVHIGGNSEKSGRTFGGMMDEVRIWKSVRTEEEIRRGMHRTIENPASIEGLLSYWRFDENTGTAYDLTGKANGSFKGNAARTNIKTVGLGQRSTLITGGEATEVGPTGGSVSISNTSGSGEDSLAVYQYGVPGGSFIGAANEDFSRVNASQRLNLVWGIKSIPKTNAVADVTFDFSAASVSDPSEVQLLKRSKPGSPWQNVTSQFTYDSNARTFTSSIVTDFGEYSIGITSGKTIYVDHSATGANDGTSWGDAFTSLQDALGTATSEDEIWIAEGIYYPDQGSNVTEDDRLASFTITGEQDGLRIFGGFENGDSFTERNPGDHPVILSGDIDNNDTVNSIGITETTSDIAGDNSYHVMLFDGGNAYHVGSSVEPNITRNTVLSGVTITGGQANGNSQDNLDQGGGLYCDGHGGNTDNTCSPTLTNIVFAGNIASQMGGGLFNNGSGLNYPGSGESSPFLINVLFINNTGVAKGGAIANYGSNGKNNPVIMNTTFIGNSANTGGAISNTATGSGTSTPKITNSIFWGNTATSDHSGDKSDEILNNSENIEPVLKSSIIKDGTGGIYNFDGPTTIYLDENGNSVSFEESSNFDSDPLFVDISDPSGPDDIFGTADDGLALQAGSPAIDAGSSENVLSSIDLTSSQRMLGTAVDIGTYEGPLQVTITGSEGWRMMTAPSDNMSYATLLDSLWLQGMAGGDVTNGTANIYTWDESSQKFHPVSDATNKPDPGQGFIVYVYNDQNYDGTPDGFPKVLPINKARNNGTVNPTLTFNDNGTTDDGFNLVGNPYGKTINWDDPNFTKTNLNAPFYVWSDSANSGTGAYVTWNGSTGTLPNGKIAPWQGFWVQANAASPALEFTEDIQDTGGVFYKKSKKEEIPQITFTLDGSRLQSKAIIMFSDKAKSGKDALDAWKLESLDKQYLSLYTTDTKRHALDINALPVKLESSTELNLDFTGSNIGGKYTLSWDPEALPAKMGITLKDTYTDRIINLNKSGEYSFKVSKNQKKAPKQSSLGKSGSSEAGSGADLEQPTHGPIPTVLQAKAKNPRFILTVNPNSGGQSLTEIPKKAELNQNYPNPFNPETVIRYGVPKQAQVQLNVYDVLGRKVRTLINEQKSPGRYEARFNGQSLASGLYFYRLKIGAKVLTKKMLLIK